MDQSAAILALSHKYTSLINSPEYKDTLGQWLDELWKANLDTLLNAKDDSNYFKAQGACLAIQFLKERGEAVRIQGESVRLKLLKKQQEELDGGRKVRK